jgi:transcriptional regulator with XRE-family HTH domain
MEFPERLKRLRTLANLTQQQLCSKVGVSVMTVRNWEM